MTDSSASTNPPKKLQLFFDGTANSAAQGRWGDATNIFRLILALHYEGNQIVNYMPGIGSRGDILSRLTARGMDEILREAYVNLASNHLPGDEIYMFGYSRGGAIALALSDIISKVGLLWADHLHELSVVWDLYLGKQGKVPLTDAKRRELQERHIESKIRLGNDLPQIKFLGLFDPVPGNSWDTLTRFSQLRLNCPKLPLSVSTAISILSVDDNRNPSFKPVLLSGRSEKTQKLEQIWMPGVHADIGGNSTSVFLSDVALLTMIDSFRSACPEIIWDDGYIDRLKGRLGRNVNVAISDERPDFARRLLRRGMRKIGDQDGFSAIDSCQKIHVVLDALRGETFEIRGRQKSYSPLNIPDSLPIFVYEINCDYRQATELALKNYRP